MDQGQGAFAVRVLEVCVELAQLPHQEHAFIDHGPAGEGGNVGVDVGLLEHPPSDVEFPVKFQTAAAVRRALHKALADAGHTSQGLFAQHLRMGGNIPPAQEFHALLGHDNLQHLLGLGPLEVVGGEEEHAHAVVSFLSQGDALGGGCLDHQLVGDLDHQSHTITGLSGGILTGAVLQLFHDLQGVVHRLVGLDAPQAHHGADAAGVVLQAGIIQLFLLRFQHGCCSNLFENDGEGTACAASSNQ